MEIPHIEPDKFASGITVSWKKTFSNYPYADGFTIAKYTLSGSGGKVDITGNYASDEWTFTLSAVDNILAAGIYTLCGYVEKGSGASVDRREIYRGAVEILTSFVISAIADTRTDAKKILDQLTTAILEYTVKPVDMISIAGRSYQRPPLLVLQKLHSRYVTIVNNEIELANRANGKGPRRILGRFGGTI